ncbi:hypothetical protein OJF2_23560 [Aquisphaera giovannonii]|uniref:Beta-galactosidase trimerisation domain-containing protein n=1 Tax=Aquisphaera giovannonii TaxID=406548 RepID=A0A5B9VZI3_9BACT|nr:hypothetical protein [Aquisphaera giovannonii]QEH33826.1 hypothetical protein OJF2_23560 [Aquisphaera giovannonii]
MRARSNRCRLTGVLFFCSIVPIASAGAADGPVPDGGESRDRTSFQTGGPWNAGVQIPADVAMCYGVDKTLPARIKGWKEHGYNVQLMTGVAWGQYQDYLYGRFDGKNHVDEAQKERNGKVISHGGDVYYLCPGPTFGQFLATRVVDSIEAGATAVYLEEPEFWARGGYSEGFKRAWKTAYGEDWSPPHASHEARYKTSKLMYALYRDALKQVFDAVKEHDAKTGKKTPCYVATHTPVNYSQWKIVSPESSLLAVGADGFIAQTWTGTARTPNVYEGIRKERTFQTAFLEYGSLIGAVRGSGGKLWLLHDPIEDDPDHSWEDYKTNWECTVTASLLWPETSRYEVVPWPDRVFHGRYPTVDKKRRKRGEKVVKEPISPAYATELVTVMNALNDMEQKQLGWECGTRGLGIVISDSMMFQRAEPDASDEHLGSFFGLALPLVERGMPAEPVQLETAEKPGNLEGRKVLLMTYEGMKPMTSANSQAVADWVKAGGVLVFVDDDRDPYNRIQGWWNAAGGPGHAIPREALFAQIGLPAGVSPGTHKAGSGTVIYDASSPARLTYQKDGGDRIRGLVRQACGLAGLEYAETDHFVLRRGPYIAAAGLDHAAPGKAHELRGRFIDLFDATLPIRTSVQLEAGRRVFLVDADAARGPAPKVLAAACRIAPEATTGAEALRFRATGPAATNAAMRIALAKAPARILVDGQALDAGSWSWDEASRTAFARFPNKAEGRTVAVE